jgi:HK97 family phage prohead protease
MLKKRLMPLLLWPLSPFKGSFILNFFFYSFFYPNSPIQRISNPMKSYYPSAITLKSLTPQGIFEGYASIYNLKDLHHEVIAPGAFAKCLKTWKEIGQAPKLLWQHDPSQPIGCWESLQEDARGLYVKGRLFLDLQKGKEAYTLLKEKVLDGLSIGFQTRKARHDASMKCRVIEDLDLFEISLVTFAANPGAKILSLKETERMDARIAKKPVFTNEPDFSSLLESLKKAHKLLN